MKHTVLTIGDKALGLGDGFILYSTIYDLAKKYNVRHIGTPQCYNILKYLHNNGDVKIFNMDTQGHYYVNDHLRAYNLTYWDTFGGLCNFGEHALNLTRRCAELEPLINKPLPDIPINEKVETAVKKFLSNFKGPIIVTQPLVN